MIPGYHFRHRVTVYRPKPEQKVDEDFGEIDGPTKYECLGAFRSYVRFFSEEERAISRTGERLQAEGKALFRIQDLGGHTIRNGDRLLINGKYAYEVLQPTPRSPRLGRHLTLEVTFKRWRTGPDIADSELFGALEVYRR